MNNFPATVTRTLNGKPWAPIFDANKMCDTLYSKLRQSPMFANNKIMFAQFLF